MDTGDSGMKEFAAWVHVNIPFAMLQEGYLDVFLAAELNPEIGLDGVALDSYSYADFQRVAEKFQDRGLAVTIHGPFVDLSAGSPDPMVTAVTRHRFEQVLRVIPLFRPRRVVCHAGYDERRHGYFRESWIEGSVSMWSWLGSRVREEGSLLVLENVYEKEPEEMEMLLKRLRNAGVGLCLDVGHHAVFSRTSIEVWLKSLSPYLSQLHLHDNLGKRDEHLALGRGKIDLHILFRALDRMGMGPIVTTLEPHREEDVQPSMDYLEKVWPW